MLPVTTDCPFLPVQGPLTTEKSTAWFTPTPLFSSLNPFFRKPAHVSFIIHVCGFQGLSEAFFFYILSMDERFSYLFIMSSVALFCSNIHSSIQVKSNFCRSKRRADRRNQSWLFRKKPLCSLLNQLVTFHYDKLNRINKTSNELFNSKYNRGTCPNAAGFWKALEMNGGHYSVCKLADVCIMLNACWRQLSCDITLQITQRHHCECVFMYCLLCKDQRKSTRQFFKRLFGGFIVHFSWSHHKAFNSNLSTAVMNR